MSGIDLYLEMGIPLVIAFKVLVIAAVVYGLFPLRKIANKQQMVRRSIDAIS
ncbi:hypothetical protein [Listeria grandensis]|uniref:Uncharacterized protein n=1 Tax=Listeria grandensis TaxID=1494963 RepID=A0A7X0Y5F7_9LIST|nr:hypothetical protein [Listeria grandensis]MBC1937289.1 hypothetical protein [Listeria grandensis]